MLNSIRNHTRLRFFCAFMALYILNCSVDTKDINPNYIPENLAINDQETLLEIVIEKVLGFENAIPEYDDTDSENNSLVKKTIAIAFFIVPDFALDVNDSNYESTTENILLGNLHIIKPYFEIHSPPPEV